MICAPWPEETQTVPAPPSSAVIRSASALTVGLVRRE